MLPKCFEVRVAAAIHFGMSCDVSFLKQYLCGGWKEENDNKARCRRNGKRNVGMASRGRQGIHKLLVNGKEKAWQVY
jgi:hypothetical protein